jgi:hypothetical protein
MSRWGATSGSASIEMVFVFMPFMTLVLGIIQVALIQLGYLGTMRAANAAVRAAVVILDDDPRRYGGVARNSAPPGSARMNDIVNAAAIALVPFEPPVPRPTHTMVDALATPAPATTLPGLLTPSGALRQKLRVSFANGTSFGRRASVTSRVELDFTCLVPLASWVMCRQGRQLHLTAQATLPNQGAPYDYQ